MFNWLLAAENCKKGWPSIWVGLFLGINLALVLMILLMPLTSRAVGVDLCTGNFPCWTKTGCDKAQGTLVNCPTKCPTLGGQGGFCYERPTPTNLIVTIGGTHQVEDLGAYVDAVYRYAVAVAGIFAAVMIMVGGIQWLTAGDSNRASAARARIQDALVGLVLTLLAYVILNTINPALVNLQLPRIPMVRPQQFIRCDMFKMQKPCGQPFSLIEKTDASSTTALTERYQVSRPDDPLAITQCVGGSCALADPVMNDAIFSCLPAANATPNTTPAACRGCGAGYVCQQCKRNGQDAVDAGPNSQCCGGYSSPRSTTPFERFCLAQQGLSQTVCQHSAEELRVAVTASTTTSAIGRIAYSWGTAAGQGYVCQNGGLGNWCSSNQECRSGKCAVTPGACGTCQTGAVGSLCSNDQECLNGMKCVQNACVPSVLGGLCDNDADCPTGDFCQEFSGGNRFCTLERERELGHTCDVSGNACPSGSRCVSIDHQYRCITGEPGTLCDSDVYCHDASGGRGTCYKDMGIEPLSTADPYSDTFSGSTTASTHGFGICVIAALGSGCDIARPLEDCRTPDGTQLFCVYSEGMRYRGICVSGHVGDPCIRYSGGRCSCDAGLSCVDGSDTCQQGGTPCYR